MVKRIVLKAGKRKIHKEHNTKSMVIFRFLYFDFEKILQKNIVAKKIYID